MLTQHDHLATERFRMVLLAPVGSSQGGRPELLSMFAIGVPVCQKALAGVLRETGSGAVRTAWLDLEAQRVLAYFRPLIHVSHPQFSGRNNTPGRVKVSFQAVTATHRLSQSEV